MYSQPTHPTMPNGLAQLRATRRPCSCYLAHVMSHEGPTSSQLLEHILSLSAGLCRIRPRASIASHYRPLCRLVALQHSFRKIFLDEPSRISIENIDLLTKRLAQFPPEDLVIASSYYGRPIAFICKCARLGIPLALAYESIAPSSIGALVDSGVLLVKLNDHANPLSLFATLDRIRREGRYLAILIDVPHQTRRRYELLGYQVAVSSFTSTYARRSGSSILPVFTSLAARDRMSYAFGTVIEDIRCDVTQALMSGLQAVIERDCIQYSWTAACTIYSDPAAKANARSFLPEALAWRDALVEVGTDVLG